MTMKRLLSVLLPALVTVALLELALPLYYKVFFKCTPEQYLERLSENSFQIDLGKLGEGEQVKQLAGWMESEVIHPYAGYVRNLNEQFIKNYGFDTDFFPIQKRGQDTFIVAVFGGSVAMHMHHALQDSFSRYFSEHKISKKVILVNLALGGYKQPQQLMILNYMLSLGSEFDVVINLDGFNEVSLSAEENYKNGVNPFYPRLWSSRMKRLLDPESMGMLTAIASIKNKAKSDLLAYANGFARKSNILTVYYIVKIQRMISEMSRYLEAMNNKASQEKFEYNGPAVHYNNVESLLEDVAGVWVRSSRQMAALCSSVKSEYFHFLQANQYDPGSKTMTEEEKTIAFDSHQPYRPWAEQGYPVLRRYGRMLRDGGVRFYDESMIFQQMAEPAYSDTCCHYNPAGNAIFADEIVNKVTQELHIQ